MFGIRTGEFLRDFVNSWRRRGGGGEGFWKELDSAEIYQKEETRGKRRRSRRERGFSGR